MIFAVVLLIVTSKEAQSLPITSLSVRRFGFSVAKQNGAVGFGLPGWMKAIACSIQFLLDQSAEQPNCVRDVIDSITTRDSNFPVTLPPTKPHNYLIVFLRGALHRPQTLVVSTCLLSL